MANDSKEYAHKPADTYTPEGKPIIPKPEQESGSQPSPTPPTPPTQGTGGTTGTTGKDPEPKPPSPPESEGTGSPNIDNRIAQQEVLLLFIEKIFQRFLGKAKDLKHVEIVRDDLEDKGAEDIKRMLNRDYGGYEFSYEDIQKFVNSLDSLTLSMLTPQIIFIKPYNGQEYRLNLENANRYAIRRFVEGAKNAGGLYGLGGTGTTRERPGGIGIKSFDLEYLTNEKSGYMWNQYKVNVEVFFDSMEDVIMEIGQAGGKPVTPVDVLIAFGAEIEEYVQRGGYTDLPVSDLYRVYIDVGYNFDELYDEEKERVRKRWAEHVSERSNLSYDAFIALLGKLKYSLEMYLTKWVWDLNENGNITLKLEYYGGNRGVGSTSYSNAVIYNSFLEKYNERVYQLKQSGLSDEEQKKKLEKHMINLKWIALSSPYSQLTRKGGHALTVPSSLLKLDSRSEIVKAVFSMFANSLISSFAQENIKVVDLKTAFPKKLFTNGAEELYDFMNMLESGEGVDTITTSVVKEGAASAETGFAIPFVFLGELIDYFARIAHRNLTRNSGKKKSFLPPDSEFVIKTGMIQLNVPESKSGKLKPVSLPIAAIPVSWDLFLEWWTRRLKVNINLVYKMEDLLSDFFGYFFKSILSNFTYIGALQYDIYNYAILCPMGSRFSWQKRTLLYYIYVMKKYVRIPLTFYIGNRYGLMKSVKFAIEEDSYMNSYFMASVLNGEAPNNNLQNQRAIYNVDIEFFGNSLVEPGMLIEVVPTIAGASMTGEERFKNIVDMGVGGLYNVVSCKISMRDNIFTTNIHAKYHGKPFMTIVKELKALTSSVVSSVSGFVSGVQTALSPVLGTALGTSSGQQGSKKPEKTNKTKTANIKPQSTKPKAKGKNESSKPVTTPKKVKKGKK